MLTIPADLIPEKNKLDTTSAWIAILDITFPAPVSDTIYISNNNENIVVGGHTYLPMQMEFQYKEAHKGEIPTFSLVVNNVNGIWTPYIDETNGAVDATVVMKIVNSGKLSSDYTWSTLNFDVIGAKVDSKSASFTLGLPSPLRRRFPLHRYTTSVCLWIGVYRGVECAYAGADPGQATGEDGKEHPDPCDGSRAACKLRVNQLRHTAFEGLSNPQFKMA